MLILNTSRYKREGTGEFETFCLCLHSNSLPLLSLTLRSALLWGAKAPVVAKLVQTRAECKLVYILPSVAELRLSKHCLLRNVPLIQEGELFSLCYSVCY